MKITVTAAEPKDNTLEAKLTVAAADVDAAIKKAYKDIANKYRFQGFRKGKAPRPVIDGLVGKDNVLAQASEDVLNEATPLMLDELDVVPVGQPTYGDEPVLVSEGADYEVTAKISLRPDCELERYDAPEINMPPAEVTDAEVAEQLETLMNYHATYEDAGEDFAAAQGDMLTLDIENVENGEDLAGTDRPFMIGSSTVPAAFNDAIKGMKVGETKDVEIAVEGHDHTDAEGNVEHHEGKTVKVKVTLKSAKKQVVPELDDEFAKKAFGYDTVDASRTPSRRRLPRTRSSSSPTSRRPASSRRSPRPSSSTSFPRTTSSRSLTRSPRTSSASSSVRASRSTPGSLPARSRSATSWTTSTPRPPSAPVSPWPSTPSPRSSTSRSPRRTSARSSRTPA